MNPSVLDVKTRLLTIPSFIPSEHIVVTRENPIVSWRLALEEMTLCALLGGT